MCIMSVCLHSFSRMVGAIYFPVIFKHLNFDLQWRERKPGNMLFKEAYSVSLEMIFGYQVSLIGYGSA